MFCFTPTRSSKIWHPLSRNTTSKLDDFRLLQKLQVFLKLSELQHRWTLILWSKLLSITTFDQSAREISHSCLETFRLKLRAQIGLGNPDLLALRQQAPLWIRDNSSDSATKRSVWLNSTSSIDASHFVEFLCLLQIKRATYRSLENDMLIQLYLHEDLHRRIFWPSDSNRHPLLCASRHTPLCRGYTIPCEMLKVKQIERITVIEIYLMKFTT